VGRGQLVQAKGIDYPLDRLLGDPEQAAALEGGLALTFYLSPRDYHRVHAPIAGWLRGYRYLPGSLLPVGPRFRREVDQLFARNERLALTIDSDQGPIALVLVGATGVGNLMLAHGALESWRLRGAGGQAVSLAAPRRLERGCEVGGFGLGSTVVLVLPPGGFAAVPDLREGPVRFGQAVARVRGDRADGSSR
jgi:phosphatidylserine decarboxylase